MGNFGKNLVKYQGKLEQAKQTGLDLNRGWAKLEQKLGQFVVFQDSLETFCACRRFKANFWREFGQILARIWSNIRANLNKPNRQVQT